MLAKAAAKAEAKARRNARRNASKRAKRAAEREVATATPSLDAVKPAGGGNGASTKKTEAARLWAHAAKMDAKSPWRPVADEFELNRQTTLDAYRLHTLPPA